MTFVVAVGTAETGLIEGSSAAGKKPNVMTYPASAPVSQYGEVDQSDRVELPPFVEANGTVDLPEATEDRNLDVTAADPGCDHRDHVAFLNPDRLVEEDGSE